MIVAFTALVVRSTTVTLEVALVLLTVSAKWRRLSTATLVGEVPTEIGLPIFCRYVGLEGSRSISEIELEPVFATTAIPVDASIATELGLLPTPSVVRTVGESVGATAKFPAVIC